MALFNDMVTLVAPYAPNVPAFTAGNAIKDAARHFFRVVHAMQEEVSINVIAVQPEYDITPSDSETEVVAILGVKRSDTDLLRFVQSDRHANYEGEPREYTGKFGKKIKLTPIPDKNETLTVSIAVKPAFNATQIPDLAFEENAEALRAGALSILKRHPGTEWYAPNEVSYYEQLFREAIERKAEEILLNNMPGNIKLDIPEFL